MLITIHNLPSHMRYGDVKSLLQTKCGLTQLILDNLVNEGKFKKVTVGLAEEEDAALLVRKINGIYLEGHQLYVEDMRQKKPISEQPYRPKQQQSQSASTRTSDNSVSQNQDYSAQILPLMGGPFTNFYNMNPAMMVQEQMARMPQPLMNNMQMYQTPYYQDPQQQANFLQQQQMQQSTLPKFQGLPSQQPKAPFNNHNNERTNTRPLVQQASAPYYQMNQTSYSQRDQRSDNQRNKPSNWQNNNNRNRSRSPHGYDNRERGAPTNDAYRNSARNTGNNIYGGANAPRMSNDFSTRRNSSPIRNTNSNVGYNYNRESRGQNSIPFSTDRPQGRARNTPADNPQGWGPNRPPAQQQNWGLRPSTDKTQNSRPQISTDQTQTWRRPPPNNESRREQGSNPNKRSVPPPSKYRWDRDSASNSQQSNRPGNQFHNKPKPEVDTNQPAPKNTGQQSSDNKKAKKITYEKLLRKDETFKQQAAAFLQKQICKSSDSVSPDDIKKFVKTLKRAVLTRLELVLQEQVGAPVCEIIAKYRRKFPLNEDPSFHAVVLKSFMENNKKGMRELLKTAPNRDENTTAQGASGLGGLGGNETKPAPSPNPQNHAQQHTLNFPPGQDIPKPGRLPKFLNANKDNYKKLKKLQKDEFENDDCYQLEPKLARALDAELDKLCNIIVAELDTATDPDEVKVCQKLNPTAVDMFRKSVKLNVTKRILDIRTNLVVRVYVHGKPPKQDAVHECLRKLGVASVKKSVGKKQYYTATCSTFDAYDRLLATCNIALDEETTLNFKPFQLIGPPKKIKKNKKQQGRFNASNDANDNFEEDADNMEEDGGDYMKEDGGDYMEEDVADYKEQDVADNKEEDIADYKKEEDNTDHKKEDKIDDKPENNTGHKQEDNTNFIKEEEITEYKEEDITEYNEEDITEYNEEDITEYKEEKSDEIDRADDEGWKAEDFEDW